MDEDALLESAFTEHQAGNLHEAARVYQELLRTDPNNVHAAYLLGCLAHQTGNQQAAASLLRRAIALSPGQAQFYNALSLSLLSSDQPAEARVAIERAIELDSQPPFWNTLGTLLRREGETEASIGAFQHALEKDLCFNEAQYNLGNAYRELGNLGAATDCFAAVVARDPEHLHSLAALGQCLLQAQCPAEARPYLERALALMPGDLSLQCDIAEAFDGCGDHEGAFAVYERCVSTQDVSRHSLSGQTVPGQNGLGQSSAVVTPLARAWYGMGCIRNAQKDFVEARRCFGSAVTLHPGWLQARHNWARTLFEMGYVSEAVRQFRLCGNSAEAAVSRAMLAVVIPGDPAATNLDVLNARSSWNYISGTNNSEQDGRETRLRSRSGRLRIGYISAFFHRDPWMKPVWGLINSHDRNRFALHLFADCALADCISSEGKGGYVPRADDVFHDTSSLGNTEVLQLIKDAQIEVLIDLNGYSSMRRLPLFFAKPAPLVVGWFNYYATSGFQTFDYLIGDEVVIPADEERFYTERILRVRGSYLTFNVQYPVPEVTARTSGDAFVFGCLSSHYKLTPEVISAWSRILHGAPNSLLLLKNKVLLKVSARDELVERFGTHGIETERLQVEGPSDHFEFLQAYDRVDLALDTFPYNGGTTTTEAIWQGVPVVCFPGDRWVARTSASLLRFAGLGQFVAAELEQYVRLAVRYATEPVLREELKALRPGMRRRLTESPVCDVAGFTQQIEDLLWSAAAGETAPLINR